MTKEEKEFVTELVSKTLGTPAAEAASLLFTVKEDGSADLKETALPTLLQKDAERVKNFKEAETKAHDKGFKKAQGEALTKFESDLKEKFGVSTDKQGVELIETIVSTKSKSEGGDIDDEKIKRSTLYLTTVERLTKEKTDAVALEKKNFEDLQNKIQKESTFKSVSEMARETLKALNPILPEGKNANGKAKSEIQIEKFLNELGSEYGFEIKDGKTLVTKDGKILEDAHGNMVDFKEIVKAKASDVWDFKQGEQRQGTGNNNDTGTGAAGSENKGYKGPIPKSEEEYIKFMGDAQDESTKMDLTKVWNEQNKL